MGILAKFIKGNSELNLNTGRYSLAQNFEPPATNISRAYGQDAYGAVKVDEEAANRNWGFEVHLSGTTVAEVKRARDNLAAFLRLAGNEAEPLYFAFRLWDDYTFEPTWGTFGAFELLEVVAGDLVTAPQYYLASMNKTIPNARIELTIKPYSQRRRQRLATAGGAVLEYHVGLSDEHVMGTMILKDSYNDFTNPVFGHDTWDNGWTVASGVATKNTNPEFVLFGDTSALLTNPSLGAVEFYQTFTPTTTGDMVISCYIKRYDGSESLDGLNLRMYKDGNIGSSVNIYHIGNGWHFVWKATTGKALAGNYGIAILAIGEGYYVDGFNLEPGTEPTFLTYGDQPGSTWTGTAHASKSKRADGDLNLPVDDLDNEKIISALAGTIRLAVRCLHPSGNLASGNYVLCTAGATLVIRYNKTNNQWEFDKSGVVVTAPDTFDQMETVILHCTWDSITFGIKIYLNGALVDSDTFSTMLTTAGLTLDIGHSSAGSQGPFVFQDIAFFLEPMTAAQVLADYTLVNSIAGDSERVGMLPYLWTATGTNTVINANDSADANWGIMAGLLGDRFITEVRGDLSADFSTIHRVFLGHLSVSPRKITRWLTGITGDTHSILYKDLQGTGTDTTLVGDEYDAETIGTTRTTLGFVPDYTRAGYEAFVNKDLYGLFRLYDAGSNLQAALTVYYNTQNVSSDYINLNTTTAYRLYLVGPLKIHATPEVANLSPYAFAVISLKRSTGSASVRGDWCAFFPNLLSLGPETSINADSFFLREDECWLGDNADDLGHGMLQVQGTPLRLEENALNIVMAAMGGLGDNDPLIAWTLEFEKVYVRPLYLLL